MPITRCVRGLLLAGLFVLAPSGSDPGTARAQGATQALEDWKQFATLLNQGRQLERANKLADATKALTECLTLVPDDPSALSELGYVQFRAGDLAQAEATTRKAIARADRAELRAASLYNLALILQARDAQKGSKGDKADKAGAIAALEQSLRLRANPAVSAALAKLDPKAIARVRVAITPMKGPAWSNDVTGAKLSEDLCWRAIAETWPELRVQPEDHRNCSEVKVKLPADSPFLDVRIWQAVGEYGWNKQVDTLAIRMKDGWYLTQFDTFFSHRWSSGSNKVVTAEVRTLGKRRVLDLRWQTSIDEWAWGMDPAKERYNQEGRLQKTTYMLLAGIGASGVPSVTTPIPIATEAAFGQQRTVRPSEVSSALTVTFPPDGGIVFTGPTLKPTQVPKQKYADLTVPLLAGKVPIEFP